MTSKEEYDIKSFRLKLLDLIDFCKESVREMSIEEVKDFMNTCNMIGDQCEVNFTVTISK